MKQHFLLVLAALSLTACNWSIPGLGAPASISTQGDGSDALEGLADTEAAHASVEAQAPTAFALTTGSAAFLAALTNNVRPLRQTLAKALLADTTVTQGLANWATASSTGRLATLKQVAALEGQVMSFTPPPIVDSTTPPTVTGMMAFYQPGDNGDIGQVTIYSSAMSASNKFLALATLVHEMRHAAQYQLVLADESNPLANAQQHTLAQSYAQAWQAMDGLGGESTLAYGDYVHLNVEFDAFETGNEVAAIVGGTNFDPTGSGFVDVQYGSDDSPRFDLLSLAPQLDPASLVAKVNQAEYTAESTQRSSKQPITRQRYGGLTNTAGLRNRGGSRTNGGRGSFFGGGRNGGPGAPPTGSAPGTPPSGG